MRALQNFTIQKIVTENTTLFMGLVGDLFPALDVPQKRDLEYEKQVFQATVDLKFHHKNVRIFISAKSAQHFEFIPQVLFL